VIIEEIPAALGGERLDRIVSLITGASRSDAAALVAAGGAVVDGVQSTSGKVRLREGQVVQVDETLLPVDEPPQPDPSVEFTVVHVDEHVIVVDKPAGLVVHPGAGNPDRTLVNGLLVRFPELRGVGESHRPGIVHRLDIGTSGLLVVARTELAYHSLVDALSAHRVGRTYRALVWGHLANPHGVVDAPIGRDHKDPMRMAVVVDGKPARTAYRLLVAYDDPAKLSAVEMRLETGRTHQIRVHAAALEFRHPVNPITLSFTSPLPPDLAAVEAALGVMASDDPPN
jgi:23S rRNA pseudouridine1911/1915/1917 synthase